MVQFYNAVFQAGLEPFEAFGTTLYKGKLAQVDLLFCPNDILDIKAEKNRQQLSFVVESLTVIVKDALANHGSLMGEIQTSPEGNSCGISDPDGNSIELIEETGKKS